VLLHKFIKISASKNLAVLHYQTPITEVFEAVFFLLRPI